MRRVRLTADAMEKHKLLIIGLCASAWVGTRARGRVHARKCM
jgi:hypothetical protein